MRDDQPARMLLRWWDTPRPAERIVAMSLAAGGVIAIVNSTVWAVAVCYMSHQRARALPARAKKRAGDSALQSARRPSDCQEAPSDIAQPVQ